MELLDQSKKYPTKLSNEVAHLMFLIWDNKRLKWDVLNQKIDLDTCPLGKLEVSQIHWGYKILAELHSIL